jgi:selenoprotein W-related protein
MDALWGGFHIDFEAMRLVRNGLKFPRARPSNHLRSCRSELNCSVVMQRAPRIEIEYCTQCRWLMRAAWMAQELLTTFSTNIGELALVPGTGGVFEIRIDDEAVWSRAEKGRFPEIKELKQIVRDRIAPGKDLGHSDR